jgi:hypothetical protein
MIEITRTSNIDFRAAAPRSRWMLSHLRTRLLSLKVRDDLLAKEADGVEHFFVLRRSDGAQ